MCQYSAVDGDAAERHLMHYGKLALPGAGMPTIASGQADLVALARGILYDPQGPGARRRNWAPR